MFVFCFLFFFLVEMYTRNASGGCEFITVLDVLDPLTSGLGMGLCVCVMRLSTSRAGVPLQSRGQRCAMGVVGVSLDYVFFFMRCCKA